MPTEGKLPPIPQSEYPSAWAQLQAYAEGAKEDGGTIDPQKLLDYMADLHREALKPIRDWMRTITEER